MSRYENPYRLDAAVVDAVLEHLSRLINVSNGEMRCDHDDMLVPLLTARHLSTLINVAFWASFKKEEGRSVNIALFFFQAEDGIRDLTVTGVQTCALPI